MREPLSAGRATDTGFHAFFINQSVQSGEPIGHDCTVMKQNKNEELQSRRQFFKKAAKTALPILGAIALTKIPVLASASESASGYCKYGCTAVCSTSACQGTCSGGCKYTCEQGCKNYGCKGVNKA